MGIERYEPVVINNLVTVTNSYGEQTTAPEAWFNSRAKVSDVAAPLRISDRYRIYYDLVVLTLNYTPNTRTIFNNHEKYSITYRNLDWRITDIKESNDRMKVTFICYRNDPSTTV